MDRTTSKCSLDSRIKFFRRIKTGNHKVCTYDPYDGGGFRPGNVVDLNWKKYYILILKLKGGIAS
jgi:hypothetical protein